MSHYTVLNHPDFQYRPFKKINKFGMSYKDHIMRHMT